MLLELRYALRRLRSGPGFALTAIATLAIAIGATAAMVGVLDAVLLRRLPFPSPDRLVMVWHELPSQGVREARAYVTLGNSASERVLSKAGFVRTRVIPESDRIRGVLHDDVEYVWRRVEDELSAASSSRPNIRACAAR